MLDHGKRNTTAARPARSVSPDLHSSSVDKELWRWRQAKREQAISAARNAVETPLVSLALSLARVAAQRDVQSAFGSEISK